MFFSEAACVYRVSEIAACCYFIQNDGTKKDFFLFPWNCQLFSFAVIAVMMLAVILNEHSDLLGDPERSQGMSF